MECGLINEISDLLIFAVEWKLEKCAGNLTYASPNIVLSEFQPRLKEDLKYSVNRLNK